jgi:hypothetical protein
MCKVLDARIRCLLAAGRHVLLAGTLRCCLVSSRQCAQCSANAGKSMCKVRDSIRCLLTEWPSSFFFTAIRLYTSANAADEVHHVQGA